MDRQIRRLLVRILLVVLLKTRGTRWEILMSGTSIEGHRHHNLLLRTGSLYLIHMLLLLVRRQVNILRSMILIAALLQALRRANILR